MVSLVKPILIHGLNKDVFWKLFKKYSFGTLNPEDYPELEDIGRKIARKLKGSPLAAKTLGSVLQSYLFNKATLVQMWMAEGFIEDKNTKMENVGSEYFLEFVNRSFFQEFEYDGFVMHDLIHDLAEMISADETYRIENNRQTKMLSTIRHLRVKEGKLPLEFSGYEKLRTLLLRKNSPPDSLFENLRSIRVLDVNGCGLPELSEHIGKLIHLRYLDLSYNSEIKILPDSLCDLYNLQTLKVKGCSALESIPQGLVKLVNLRYIYANVDFWVMIKDVRRLTNLQELPTFSVQEEDELKLGQLKDLTQLHETLYIQNLENVVDSKEAKRPELKNKVHLKELKLEWNHEKDAKLEEEGWDDVLPFIGQRLHLIKLRMYSMPALKQLSHEFEGKCFPKLEVLQLTNLPALEEWSWTEGKDLFPCMRELRVSSCPKLKRLPPFPPSLEILTIEDCPKLMLNSKTEDDEEGGCHLPPPLKVLKLSYCGRYAKLLPDCLHNLRLVTQLAINDCPYITSISLVQLVELQCLCISNCDELIRMECLGLLKSLWELKIVRCSKLVQLDVGDEQAGSLSSLRKLCVGSTALLTMFPLRNSLPFITELVIESCSEEVIFEEAILVRDLIAVTYLSFSDCKKLQSLPTELLQSLPSLQTLVIDCCPQIQSLPEKGLPLRLEFLFISGCPQIQAMPDEGLPMSLNIFHCFGDVHPTLMEQSKRFKADRDKLQYLYISNCDELRNMECLRHLKSLKELTIVGCPKLVRLDVEDKQAGGLSSLRKLCVDNTALLKMSPLRHSLPFITELVIESCSEEVIFEEAILVRSLTAVTSLTFSDCKKLQSLPTELLHSLPFLEKLMMFDCPQIKSLPEKGLPPSLRTLRISCCPQIQSLPEKGLPPFLRSLCISGCPQIQAIPKEGLPKSLSSFDCSDDVHPTLKEQSKKFTADRIVSL
ncbi:hypothetical protein ZIOFF_000219 [Zingiber officinale]|uniref:Uncharacterized protein n=1 Tax=Zingiber officinale TaxID=94328 RepID=A0A8J5I4B6_ZINOF|nr:hypothetical protein ZIOFF_000219 [Zingiber officinale]